MKILLTQLTNSNDTTMRSVPNSRANQLSQQQKHYGVWRHNNHFLIFC